MAGLTVTLSTIKIEAGTNRGAYITWTFSKEAETQNYSAEWQYYVKDNNQWFTGQTNQVTNTQSKYSVPENATQVRVRVTPNSKTHEVPSTANSAGSYSIIEELSEAIEGSAVTSTTQEPYYTGETSAWVTYSFGDSPTKPSRAPTVSVDNLVLTAEYENFSGNATQIEFQVFSDRNTKYTTFETDVTRTNYAGGTCVLKTGTLYQVRARSIYAGNYSEWSDFSSAVYTQPSVPTWASKNPLTAYGEEGTAVQLSFNASPTATSYNVEYAKEKAYFGTSSEVRSSTGYTSTTVIISGLDSGTTWYFRIQAVGNGGESSWSDVQSIKIGIKPAAPTTWSSTSTAIAGDPVYVYWVHNATDGSYEESAWIKYKVGSGSWQTIGPIANEREQKGSAGSYLLDIPATPGVKISWQIQTKGTFSEKSPWSTTKVITIYERPSVAVEFLNSSGVVFPDQGNMTFPIMMHIQSSPVTQNVTGYFISVTAKNGYNTYDNVGVSRVILAGEEVFSTYFNNTKHDLSYTLTAVNAGLDCGQEYYITVKAAFGCGLTATVTQVIGIQSVSTNYILDASIGYNTKTYTCTIRPRVYLADGATLATDMNISVYRRDFDGQFTHIGDVKASKNNKTTLTDPHPALDFARYRLVATNVTSGEMSIYDPPGKYIGQKGIIINWDETVNEFDYDGDRVPALESFSGSVLVLLMDVDTSDSYASDCNLVKYAGRRNPVSYYGTQDGVTSSWSFKILKRDMVTLTALRRLALYKGNVYVRERTGAGYYAHVVPSFSINHTELTIPVTLDVTRVEEE